MCIATQIFPVHVFQTCLFMPGPGHSSDGLSSTTVEVVDEDTLTDSLDQLGPHTTLMAKPCKPRFFLDIFSGAMIPVSTACRQFSIDMFEPVDLIHGWDILDDDVFHQLLCLCESGLVGAALAAPYCCKHSRATLRRPGPKPVRTPEYLDGLPGNSVLQQIAVQESAAVHDRARLLLSAVARSNGLVILENPATSMTWLDDLMWTWVHTIAPYAAQASACQFGANWAKTWCFVSNKPQIQKVALSCTHGPGTHESVVGVKLPDGTWKPRLTAEYPVALASALASIVKPFTTANSIMCPLAHWKSQLPLKLDWPRPTHRVEDGGGLPSSAPCHVPLSISPWPTLRRRLFERLCSTKQCFKVVAHLESGNAAPPLSEAELQPYLADLLDVFQAQHMESQLAVIAPGQPFRLHLWKLLVSTWDDRDAPFLDTLAEGVRLGVNGSLAPSPAWPHRTGVIPDDQPLIECSSSWKSALDHPSLVRELIAAEVSDGFIAHVPGGIKSLNEHYEQVAVGKLGIVLAEGRSPRLVVDSSVSNVTANTVIPNHMLLPKISDLIQCAPEGNAVEQFLQLTLDVSKAHRL